jgi:hypothetical protein
MIWAFGIAAYTLLSIWYFLEQMGNKNSNVADKWYVYPILLPALVIVIVVGTVHKIIVWSK